MLTNYIHAAMRKHIMKYCLSRGARIPIRSGMEKAILAAFPTFREFGRMQIHWKLVERNCEKS